MAISREGSGKGHSLGREMVDVSRLSKRQLKQLMINAQELGRDDVYWTAFRRVCELEGRDHADPLHKEFYQMLAAYEELLSAKNGRTTTAARTRQKLAKKGIEECLVDWAISSTTTEGFKTLVAHGLAELTGEYLVIKYANRFLPHVVQAAKRRLESHGIGTSTT